MGGRIVSSAWRRPGGDAQLRSQPLRTGRRRRSVMTIRALAMPWALSGERTYCLPGSLIVTLALGEAPETIPSLYDVRRGHARPATALDGGAIDRIVRHFAGDATLVARVHSSAASWRHPGQRHRGFDAAEQISG